MTANGFEFKGFKNEHGFRVDIELFELLDGLSEDEFNDLPQELKNEYFRMEALLGVPESDEEFVVRNNRGTTNLHPHEETEEESTDSGTSENQSEHLSEDEEPLLDDREPYYPPSMLSISAPIHGVGKANYYLQLAREDYYIDGGEPPGVWFGGATKDFGLSGEVTKDALHNMLLGYSNDGTKKLVQNAGDLKRASAWDLTFSAPKSVSVAWALAPEEIRIKIQEAQQKAVQGSLEYLEGVAGLTRRQSKGTRLESAALAFALFEHGTSRAQDPQLHTHCLLLNSCLRVDETTGTLWTHNLYRHKMAAGAIYRVELASELMKLGFSVLKTKIGFELDGISDTLCDFFSKRRHEIEQALDRKGESGAKASEAAAFETREAKTHTPRKGLFAQWKNDGRPFGVTDRQIAKLCQAERIESKQTFLEALAQGIAEVSKQHSFFPKRTLVQAVADNAAPLGVDFKTVLRGVKTVLGTPALVRIGENKGEKLYATQQTLDLEKDIIQTAEAGRHSTEHQVTAEKAERVISKHERLSDEQKAAIRHITTEEGTIKLVNGLAGTGKSTMLDVARQIWEKDKLTVLGTSYTGKASRGLEESANIQSFTLAKLLIELEKRSFGFETRYQLIAPNAPEWSPVHGKKIPYLSFFVKEKEFRIDKDTVIVLDEASMVSTSQLHTLMGHCQKVGAKLVAVGDPKQLQSIEAGGGFLALEGKLGSAKLADIRRQVDEGMRSVVEHFSKGQAKEALEKAKQLDLIHVAKNKTQAIDNLVSQWKTNGGLKNPEEHFILAGTNGAVGSLNRFAQDARKRAGELSLSSVRIQGERMYKGDRVVFTQNSTALGVDNGSFGTITHLGNKQLAVKLDSGKIVNVPLRQYDHLKLGYAATTHKAQGATVKYVYVLLEEMMQDMHMTYVQASRASHLTRFYTDKKTTGKDFESLANIMSQAHPKIFATEIQDQTWEPEQERQRAGAHQRSEAKTSPNSSEQEKPKQARENTGPKLKT